MTRKKDKKKLVRERMAKTGESYRTALMHIEAAEAPRGESAQPWTGFKTPEDEVAPAAYFENLTKRSCLDCGEMFVSTGGENVYCDDCMFSMMEAD